MWILSSYLSHTYYQVPKGLLIHRSSRLQPKEARTSGLPCRAPPCTPTPTRSRERALTYCGAAWSTRFSGHLKARRHTVKGQTGDGETRRSDAHDGSETRTVPDATLS